MKTVEIQVFKFSELSDSAKRAAFKKWREEKSQWQYDWLAEFEEVLDLIEEESGFKVRNWEFDEYNYRFSLDAPEVNTDDLPDWFEFWEKVEAARNAKNTHGKRAQKRLPNAYAMPIKNECFSGIWLSQIFSDSLLNHSKLTTFKG